MNYDTKEVWNWIIDGEYFAASFQECIGNEIHFIYRLHIVIKILNHNGNEIDETKVNGNELYVDFCELFGNEQYGWK